MEAPDDKEILKLIQDGQIQEFSHLVTRYMSRVKAFISPRLYDKVDVDDLVQTTFIKFYKAIDRFDIKRPVLPYLLQIAKNEMKMYFRAHKSSVSLDEAVQITSDETNSESTDVKELLKNLNAKERKALQLLYDGYSYNDIAKELNAPINTIRTIIRRGRLKVSKIKNNVKT